jgi:branched-chain amino acid aminotransferase
MLQKFNPANGHIKVFIKDRLYSRADAKISVFDSSVQGGDAVWEGLRIYNGRAFAFSDHVNRLQESAKTLAFADIPSFDFIKSAVRQTLEANNMFTDVHIRLTLTRGEKITSGMDPRLNTFGSCLIVLAEFKPPVFDNLVGIRLITSHIRRNSPAYLDSKIHHNNLINNILAKIEANHHEVDEALMLDKEGFVAETNSCNIFFVKDGILLTPTADACLPGITRRKILQIAEELNIPCVVRNISLSECYHADEAFTTGTMGELTPVIEIDKRKIENKNKTSLLPLLSDRYRVLTLSSGELMIESA